MIGVAAVGVGRRLVHLLELLFLEERRPDLKLIAVADSAEAVAKEVGKLFDCPYYPNLESLLRAESDKVSWIMVGSINSEHAQHCITAFKAGKHVFCEKPIAISVQECKDILDAQRESGKHFATGFVLRHAPVYAEVQRLIASGVLGRLVSIDANELLYPDHGAYIFRNWRRHQDLSGGHLLEKCCHDIDLLNWMIDSVPARVASFGGKNIFIPENAPVAQKLAEEQKGLYRAWPAWEDVDPFTVPSTIVDNQVCIMEYRNAVRVTFHTNVSCAWPQRRMLVMGVEGALEADMWTGKIKVQRVSEQTERIVDVNIAGSGHGGGDSFLIDDLVRSMRTGEQPKATGAEGMRSAVACLALEEAMEKGAVVSVEPYWALLNV